MSYISYLGRGIAAHAPAGGPSALGIVTEHEKRTLEHVRATPLTSGEVVTGKIIATVDAGLVLLCILVPLQFWTMLLGGPTPGEWLGSVVLLVGLVVWASCLGTAISAVSLNTVSAVVRAFVILGLLRVVPYLGMVFSMVAPRTVGIRGAVSGHCGRACFSVAYRAFAGSRYAIARGPSGPLVSCLRGLLLAFADHRPARPLSFCIRLPECSSQPVCHGRVRR